MKLELGLEIPDFTPWHPRLGRANSQRQRFGVYIHGLIDTPDNQPADPLDIRVAYIGVATCTFSSRISKFYRTLNLGYDSPFGSTNHTGAQKARDMGYTEENFKTALCVLGNKQEALLAERMLIHLFYQRHGRVPMLNKN
jgi:hypothetical protein